MILGLGVSSLSLFAAQMSSEDPTSSASPVFGVPFGLARPATVLDWSQCSLCFIV